LPSNIQTPDLRAATDAEAQRIQESVMYSAQGQFEASKVWRMWNWLLGGFTAAASGLAGVLTFASDGLQTLSGCLALAAAVTAATDTTIKPDKRAERAQTSANEYLSIQAAVRKFQALDVPTRDFSDLRQLLDDYSARIDAINMTSDPIPRFAYKKASKNISKGGQNYAVDIQAREKAD
jgi:hypothetical protein